MRTLYALRDTVRIPPNRALRAVQEMSRLPGETAGRAVRPGLVCTAAEALDGIEPADVVMVGGFGLVGQPLTLVTALLDAPGARQLTIISNNLGEPGRGLGRVLLAGQISRAVGSFFTSNPDVLEWHAQGRLELTLMPQGTM